MHLRMSDETSYHRRFELLVFLHRLLHSQRQFFGRLIVQPGSVYLVFEVSRLQRDKARHQRIEKLNDAIFCGLFSVAMLLRILDTLYLEGIGTLRWAVHNA